MEETVPVLLGFVLGLSLARARGNSLIMAVAVLALTIGPVVSLLTGEVTPGQLTTPGGSLLQALGCVALDTLQVAASAAVAIGLTRSYRRYRRSASGRTALG